MSKQELKRLSDLVSNLGKNRTRYITLFRAAVADGEVQAAELTERFQKTPKTETSDFAIIYDDDFKQWHADALLKSQTRENLPTFKEALSGEIDLQKQIEATRKKLQESRKRSAKSNAKRRKDSENTQGDTE